MALKDQAGLPGREKQQEQVQVILRGTQTLPDGWTDTSLIEAEGIFRYAAGAQHILFVEADPLSGSETKTHIVLRERTAEVHKRGAVEVDFSFIEGEWTKAVYQTEFGGIPMRLFTKQFLVTGEKTDLKADFSYELCTGEEPGIFCRIEIEIHKMNRNTKNE